jgi:nitrile hydratase accessory protein
MSHISELAELPLLPRNEEGPVFAEPWQAQAFAVVVELIEAGKITRQEWADYLGLVLKEAEEQGEYDTGRRYYDHWLAAIELAVVEKKLTGWEDLKEEASIIRENDHHRREHQLQGEH